MTSNDISLPLAVHGERQLRCSTTIEADAETEKKIEHCRDGHQARRQPHEREEHTLEHHSVFSKSTSGPLVTTRVAASDDSRPVTNTANMSNAPAAVNGIRPPRSATAGPMASAAHNPPATSPPVSNSAFSAAAMM